MIDISGTVEVKSDQLNSDDLITGARILEITAVKKVNSPDQPIVIDYKGANGHPYKPCKSMRRILILGWGANGENYIGRQIEVFNDPNVKWAGKNYGGIRISKMSHLKQELNTMLTVSRGRKAPYKVLKIEVEAKVPVSESALAVIKGNLDKAKTMADLQVIAQSVKAGNYDEASTTKLLALYNIAKDRINNPQNAEVEVTKEDIDKMANEQVLSDKEKASIMLEESGLDKEDRAEYYKLHSAKLEHINDGVKLFKKARQKEMLAKVTANDDALLLPAFKTLTELADMKNFIKEMEIKNENT